MQSLFVVWKHILRVGAGITEMRDLANVSLAHEGTLSHTVLPRHSSLIYVLCKSLWAVSGLKGTQRVFYCDFLSFLVPFRLRKSSSLLFNIFYF